MSRRVHDDERGIVGPAMMYVLFMLMVVLGIVIDVSGQMRAMQQADAVAREAGRQGAQALDVAQAMNGGGTVVDPLRAKAAAQSFLSSNGVDGTVTVLPGGTRLAITTTTSYRPIALGIIGIKDLSARGSAEVELVQVVAGQER